MNNIFVKGEFCVVRFFGGGWGLAWLFGRITFRNRMAIKKPGDVLLSHAVTHIVPSTLQGLTAVFGKGTGVAPAQLSPGILVHLTVGRAECARRGRRKSQIMP